MIPLRAVIVICLSVVESHRESKGGGGREGGGGGVPLNGADCPASQMHSQEDQSAMGV